MERERRQLKLGSCILRQVPSRPPFPPPANLPTYVLAEPKGRFGSL